MLTADGLEQMATVLGASPTTAGTTIAADRNSICMARSHMHLQPLKHAYGLADAPPALGELRLLFTDGSIDDWPEAFLQWPNWLPGTLIDVSLPPAPAAFVSSSTLALSVPAILPPQFKGSR